MVHWIRQQGVRFGMLWFDVEQCNSCWHSDLADNMSYLTEAVQAAVAEGVSVGIYSSNYEWCQTVGCDATGLQQYPLWYANWDGAKSFSDFEPFGGWEKPAIKQYADKGDSDCDVPVDLDWY